MRAGRLLTALSLMVLGGCTGLPANVTPVEEFEVQRYLGRWYEIARLDHSFERGLEQVTADYSLRTDGGLKVVNRGYDARSGEWREAQGKAYFVRGEELGYLKVSFFGPFYGSYVIFRLEQEDYRYAFVAGPNDSYLWLLSRTPTVSGSLVEEFTKTASRLGFDTSQLIFVPQR